MNKITYDELFDSCVFFSIVHPDWSFDKVIEFAKQYLSGQQQSQIRAG
jgi:hypothetical protein